MPATISQSYLLAIRDERALLNAMIARGEYEPAKDAPAILANIREIMAQGFSGDMAEYMRGSRDFWIGQVSRIAKRIPSN